MSKRELEEHRHDSPHDMPEAPDAGHAVSVGSRLTAAVATAWLAVCIPIVWGIWMTVQRAAVLL